MNSYFLKKLDRIHSVEDSKKILLSCKIRKINFSVDLMLGLPDSEHSCRNIEEELIEILSYNPSHLSVYILTVDNSYKYFDELPSEEYISVEYKQVSDFLIKNGFNHYEVSNFSKPGYESKHNLKYWNSQSVASLGASATGYLAKKKSGLRYKWKLNKNEIEEELLDFEAVNLEEVYMRMRTNQGISTKLLKRFSYKFNLELLSKWEKSEFVRVENDKLYTLPKGFLLLDSLMNDLF